MDTEAPGWQSALRWVALLPAAIAGSLLASVVVRLLNWISMWLTGMNPDGFLSKLWMDVVSSALIGVAFVYIGGRVAPKNRKEVGYVLTVVVILVAGFLAFPAVAQHNWWALLGCIAMAAGGAGVAYSLASGELDLESHTLT